MEKDITIFIAEDDSFLLRMYTKKLVNFGFNVISAPDGESAIRSIRKHIPSVILLDILMPKKDGFAVLQEIKADPQLKTIPVIMLTNLSEPEDIKRARKLGANEYMIKTHFLPSEVVEKIQEYII